MFSIVLFVGWIGLSRQLLDNWAWRWLPQSDALKKEKRAAEAARTTAEHQQDALRKQLTHAKKMEAIGRSNQD